MQTPRTDRGKLGLSIQRTFWVERVVLVSRGTEFGC